MLYTQDRFNKSKMRERPDDVWMRRNKLVSNTGLQLSIMAITLVVSVIIAACM